MEWLIQKATADPIFRADLPFLGPMESQDERDHQLTSRCVGLINENRIDTYRRYLASQASERTTLYLDTITIPVRCDESKLSISFTFIEKSDVE